MPDDPFWKVRPFEYLAEYLFSIVLLLCSMMMAGLRKLVQWPINAKAEHWTIANGTVTTGNVDSFHGKINDYAVGRIGYSYNVNGDYYSGYLTRQFNDEQRAWDFVDARKDSQVLIRYKPNRPQIAVLRESDQSQWPPELPFDFWDWIPVALRKGKRSWPTVQAVVESVGTRRLENDEGGGLVHELVFSYSVKDSYYSGVFRFSAGDAETIEEWKGEKVIVHYQPERPSTSVLFKDEQHHLENSKTAK